MMISKQELQRISPAAIPFLAYAYENRKKGGHWGVFPGDESLRKKMQELDPLLKKESAYGNFLHYLKSVGLIEGVGVMAEIRVIRCGITEKGISLLHELPQEERQAVMITVFGNNSGNINSASFGSTISESTQISQGSASNHKLVEELLSEHAEHLSLKEGKEIESLKAKEDWKGLKKLLNRILSSAKQGTEFVAHLSTVIANLAL